LAQLVHNYLDKLDGLQEEVIQNADNILDAIDMDDLLNDPEGYLLALGDAFLKEHIDEIQEADKEGKKFAEKVLKKS
jgi:hypothetical protein